MAAVVFADTNLCSWSPWSWWLVAAVALMVAYEACWIRYFVSDRTVLAAAVLLGVGHIGIHLQQRMFATRALLTSRRTKQQ